MSNERWKQRRKQEGKREKKMGTSDVNYHSDFTEYVMAYLQTVKHKRNGTLHDFLKHMHGERKVYDPVSLKWRIGVYVEESKHDAATLLGEVQTGEQTHDGSAALDTEGSVREI